MEVENTESKALAYVGSVDKTSRKRQLKIHDEETHTSNVEKIIVRDFFPDLPKVQAQVEYLEALERKDTQKIWKLQQQFSLKRPTSLASSTCAPTPSTFETPESRIAVTPLPRPDTESTNKQNEEPPTRNPAPPEITDESMNGLSLDKYLSQNTSEDNVSFVDIMKESERKHRMKHAWLFDKEEEQLKEHEEILALPSAEEQQCSTSTSNKKVCTWKYVARNAVMYVPDGAELTPSEKIEKAGEIREIVHMNTRFENNPFNIEKHKETITQAASIKAMKLLGKIGPDGKEILPAQSPKVGGYGFVATPSIVPGVDASPLMTWGEIDGTPFRLDCSDTPIFLRTPGPIFKIPDVPHRDRCLHALAEKASKAHRAKKQEALKQVRSTFASPSPKFSQSKTDRFLSLSPAAQQLANKRLKINSKSDKALRSSYTPSPGHRLPGDSTPIIASSPSSAKNTPSSSTQRISKTPNQSSLTDNLLQLPKRQNAQEYF